MIKNRTNELEKGLMKSIQLCLKYIIESEGDFAIIIGVSFWTNDERPFIFRSKNIG